MAKKTIPAISIIIPMYNTEKYIGQCLESILAQTFKDFEVIVVDDCSTDKSCAVVESYASKFKGKLQLIRSKVNSGGAGTPRNIGIRTSIGEYLFFMDSDDAIIEDALEKTYNAAINFNADVVHVDNCYKSTADKIDKKNIEVMTRTSTPVNAPTYLPEELAERVKMFIEFRLRWEPWNFLINRDFMLKENLTFSNLSIADDMLFGFFLICLAKKVIVLPDLIYIWRKRNDSNSSEVLEPNKIIHRKAGDVMRSIPLIEEFAGKIEFFKKNPQFKFAVFDFFAKWAGSINVIELYSKVPAFQLDPLIRQEIKEIGDCNALTAYIFARMNVFNVNLMQQQNIIRQQQQKINELQAQLQQAQNPAQLNNEDIFKLN